MAPLSQSLILFGLLLLSPALAVSELALHADLSSSPHASKNFVAEELLYINSQLEERDHEGSADADYTHSAGSLMRREAGPTYKVTGTQVAECPAGFQKMTDHTQCRAYAKSNPEVAGYQSHCETKSGGTDGSSFHGWCDGRPSGCLWGMNGWVQFKGYDAPQSPHVAQRLVCVKAEDTATQEASTIKFTLRGRKGEEQIKIVGPGGKVVTDKETLSTSEKTFEVASPFTVQFLNDNGPRDIWMKMVFPSGDVKSVVNIEHPNFKGWKCGTSSENKRCNSVRSGTFAWNGVYTITAESLCAKRERTPCSCSGTVYYGRKYVNSAPKGGQKGGGATTTLKQLMQTPHKKKSGSSECSNSVHGDPMHGVWKWCYCVAGADGSSLTQQEQEETAGSLMWDREEEAQGIDSSLLASSERAAAVSKVHSELIDAI